jgi:hypothetical protein
MGRTWLVVPDDGTLSRRSGWEAVAGDRYSTVRTFYVLETEIDPVRLRGPVLQEQEIPAGSTFRRGKRQARVEKSILSLQRTLVEKLSASVGMSMSASVKASLGVEKVAHAERSVATTVEQVIASAVEDQSSESISHSSELTDETDDTITINADDHQPHTRIVFYPKVRRCTSVLYLIRKESAEVFYRGGRWRDPVREIIHTERKDRRSALSTYTWYLPDPFPSVAKGDFVSDVEEIDVRMTRGGGTPPLGDPSGFLSLEALIDRAFPVEEGEQEDWGPVTRVIRRVFRPRRPAAKKSAAKAKRPAKKRPAKKAAAKRMGSASRRSVAKKSAKKASKKRSAAKRSAGKRTARRPAARRR